jgi:hypothetical protein
VSSGEEARAQEYAVPMAAMTESAPGAGIDDIVGGMRAMKTESKEDGDTDALTTAELMERWVSARAAFVLRTDSARWRVCPTWWRMTGRRRASQGAGASVDLSWQGTGKAFCLRLLCHASRFWTARI